jgi:hypothetical protein
LGETITAAKTRFADIEVDCAETSVAAEIRHRLFPASLACEGRAAPTAQKQGSRTAGRSIST